MWKNYSADYIKNNLSSAYSVMTAAFMASLFLSFLCSLFYNFWLDSMREAEKETPWALAVFYVIVTAFMCMSMILVIYHSFAVSMNSRIYQFGIFSSIGAAPKQIRTCLMQEAFALTLLPILSGILTGILCGFGTVCGMSAFAEKLAGGRSMAFTLHPAMLAVILFLCLATVYISARIPAGKLGRMMPLEAVRGTGELELSKKKSAPVLSFLFGMEGELAGNALKAQKKAMRAASISLVLAFLGFMLMQCFFTISSISTNHTYFEAYQDAWDVMVTVKDTKIEAFEAAGKIREVEEAGGEAVQKAQEPAQGKAGPGQAAPAGCTVYQKAEAVSVIPAESVSPELLALGGPEKLGGSFLSAEENAYLIKTALVILDDKSFAEYCGQIGIEPGGDGIVLWNQIWDSTNSNFRYRTYVPYIKEDTRMIALRGAGPAGEAQGALMVDIPILACTQECPVLREEYEDYALVQFMPLSLWSKTAGQAGTAEKDLFIRVLAGERDSLEALTALEEVVLLRAGEGLETESENRIQEKMDNDRMIWGYKMLLGFFCTLFAVIGIAHVFSNTLGFLRQRKREFARYMSVGLTPEGMRKILCIEAVSSVGRPALVSLILTSVSSFYMIKISYMDPMEFIREAPVVPILLFVLAVFGAAGLAYYLGGRKILRADLAEILRDDTVL